MQKLLQLRRQSEAVVVRTMTEAEALKGAQWNDTEKNSGNKAATLTTSSHITAEEINNAVKKIEENMLAESPPLINLMKSLT